MDTLDSRFRFYIHIDKRSSVTPEESRKLSSHPACAFVSRQYQVNWAGFHHLRAMILLLEEASKDSRNGVFHMISGQDFPIKSADEIVRLFELNTNKQYIENFPMPAGHWEHGGMHRLWHWYFYDLFNYKSRFGYYTNKAISKFQNLFGIKRNWPKSLPPLYGGGTWWSITRECTTYVVEYRKKNPALLNRLKFTLCPEEMYFQTIIMNSPFAEQAVSDHLRYIDWSSRNGNAPANLDISDYYKLLSSDKLFARKFEYPVSEELLKQLNRK